MTETTLKFYYGFIDKPIMVLCVDFCNDKPIMVLCVAEVQSDD